MALEFKRSRLDMAHQRTFPNSKEEVIARTDVSNKNLLKNPFRTGDIAVGPVGVQNRPPNKMVDDRGAMYGGSVSVLRKDISNTNLLMNPYRFKTDPIDEPRTLSRQVIMDINSGKTPKYVRENKGIDEIAFMIVKALPDNGVKLATLSMLKSYITGIRLQSVLDQGGQNVVKAFDVLNQLVVTCTSLYKTGMLAMKLPGLLLQYSEDIAKVFNESVLQPVSPMLMFSAIQDLASVSSVLTKLFRAQNTISPATNVSIDEWARQEAAKLQAIRQQEAANTAPPVPVQVQQVTVAGDNQPTGTQGIKDADTIKQEGTGKKRKKKKLSEMMGGAQLNWGIAGTDNTQLTPPAKPSLIQNEPIIAVNVNPTHSENGGTSSFDRNAHIAGVVFGLTVAAGATVGTLYSGWKTIKNVIDKDAVLAALQEKSDLAEEREQKRDERDKAIVGRENRRRIEEAITKQKAENWNYINDMNQIPKNINRLLELMKIDLKRGENVDAVYLYNLGFPDKAIQWASFRSADSVDMWDYLTRYYWRSVNKYPPPNTGLKKLGEEQKDAVPVEAQDEEAAALPSGNRKRIKKQDIIKSKIKKSKNLDAQILALLRA